VSVLCSTSLSPVDDLGSLSIDQIAQLGLSSLQVIYYSEQLFRVLRNDAFSWSRRGQMKRKVVLSDTRR
ncbi:hypothetical protein, partial [Symbiopectobacterium sp.]|uniref:hypothetical protein n=1 Tax=Symbiopectobacterium sp. TaxID=2952789 RepID=UPI003F397E36